MRYKGFSAVELLVTIAVTAIVAVIAVPSFTSFLDRYRVKGAADVLYADLQFARSEAVRRNSTVYVVFSEGANWCYGINIGGVDCSCSTGSCDIKNVIGTDFKDTTLDANVDSVWFSPRLGTAGGGTIALQSKEGKEVRVVLGVVGRVKMCSPSGSANVSGYPTC